MMPATTGIYVFDHRNILNSGHLPLGVQNISLEACQLEAISSISAVLISLFSKRV